MPENLIHATGIGTDNDNRRDGFEVYTTGEVWCKGPLYVGGVDDTGADIYQLDRTKAKEVATIEYVDSKAGGVVTSLNGQTGALITKTLFGTSSLLGAGNIDLYKHVINFSFENNNFNMVVYSSKAFNVNSLTDLNTLIGDAATENVSGLVYDGASSSYYPVVNVNTETLEVFYVHTQNGLVSVSLSDYTLTDTVTTI